MARVYDFAIPYTVPAFMMGLASERVRPVWDDLPRDLQLRFRKAYDSGSELVITKADLDEIGDEQWAHLATALGLQWHPG